MDYNANGNDLCTYILLSHFFKKKALNKCDFLFKPYLKFTKGKYGLRSLKDNRAYEFQGSLFRASCVVMLLFYKLQLKQNFFLRDLKKNDVFLMQSSLLKCKSYMNL